MQGRAFIGVASPIALMALTAASAALAAGGQAEVPILASSPVCVQERLGRVQVELGSKEIGPPGVPTSSVSHKRAFAKLSDAASEKGGDAVVLRHHEVAFIQKGHRKTSRPSYIALHGAVVRLDDGHAACALQRIDPIDYGRKAARRERQDIVVEKGVSF